MWKRRTIYGLVLLAMVLFIIFLKEYLSFFVLVFFLILPVASLVLLLVEKNQLELEFQLMQAIVKRDEQAVFQLSAQNRRAFLPTPVRIKFQVENPLFRETSWETILLPVGREKQVLRQPVRSSHCGRVSLQIEEVRIYDPLGLFYFRKKQLPERRFILVMPTVAPLSLEVGPQLEGDLESERFSTKKPGDDPAQVFEIRPYRPGDRVHRMHWKLSSKMDELMVKEYSLPIAASIMFVVDGTWLEYLDGLLDTLASLLDCCQQNGLEYSLGWYGTNQTIIPVPKSEEGSLSITLSYLFAATEQKGEPLLEQMENGLNGISHLIYLCGQPDLKLVGQFSEGNPRARRTILEMGAEIVEKIPAGWDEVAINPAQMETSLFGFLL